MTHRAPVAGYTATGTLDPTFGEGDGRVETELSPAFDGALGVALQPDGQILAAGGSRGSPGWFALARYHG